jgi:hypothetical protein
MKSNPKSNQEIRKIGCDRIEVELGKLNRLIEATFLKSRTDAERDSMVTRIDVQQNKIASLFAKLPPRIPA